MTDLNGGVVEPGDVLEYVMLMQNTGKDAARNTVLTDPIPPGAVFVPGSLVIVSGANAGTKTDEALDDQAGFDAINNRVVFRLCTGATALAGGRLAITLPDSRSVVRFHVRVPEGTANGFVVSNRANLTFTGETIPDSFTAQSNVASVPVVASPRIAPTKTVVDLNGGTAVPGDTLRYPSLQYGLPEARSHLIAVGCVPGRVLRRTPTGSAKSGQLIGYEIHGAKATLPSGACASMWSSASTRVEGTNVLIPADRGSR